MRRKPLSRNKSRKIFKKNTGVHKANRINTTKLRGGIRL